MKFNKIEAFLKSFKFRSKISWFLVCSSKFEKCSFEKNVFKAYVTDFMIINREIYLLLICYFRLIQCTLDLYNVLTPIGVLKPLKVACWQWSATRNLVLCLLILKRFTNHGPELMYETPHSDIITILYSKPRRLARLNVIFFP